MVKQTVEIDERLAEYQEEQAALRRRAEKKKLASMKRRKDRNNRHPWGSEIEED